MATKAQIDGGKKGRQEGEDFENTVAIKLGGTKPKDKKDIWDEITTTAKTDVRASRKNYSIKNSTGSTQIQICSVNRFCRLFNPPEHIKLKMDMFFGNHHLHKADPAFKTLCEKVWKLDVTKLNKDSELRRCRVLANNIQGFNEVVKWIEKNKRKILKFILKTSFNKTSDRIVNANHMIWVTEKNNFDTSVYMNINTLIKHVCKNKNIVKVRPSQSVIEIGPFTLQMKGSGDNSKYHCMQFNASLKDVRKYIDQKLVTENFGLSC